MNARFAIVKRHAKRAGAVVGSALLTLPVLAQSTEPTTATGAITQAKTDILGLVAVGGLAMVVIALAFVGWKVGTKFVKRLGGSA